MPSAPRPNGRLRPAAARINARIRRLMDEERDQTQRTEEYQHLLVQWADATRSSDLTKAA